MRHKQGPYSVRYDDDSRGHAIGPELLEVRGEFRFWAPREGLGDTRRVPVKSRLKWAKWVDGHGAVETEHGPIKVFRIPLRRAEERWKFLRAVAEGRVEYDFDTELPATVFMDAHFPEAVQKHLTQEWWAAWGLARGGYAHGAEQTLEEFGP